MHTSKHSDTHMHTHSSWPSVTTFCNTVQIFSCFVQTLYIRLLHISLTVVKNRCRYSCKLPDLFQTPILLIPCFPGLEKASSSSNIPKLFQTFKTLQEPCLQKDGSALTIHSRKLHSEPTNPLVHLKQFPEERDTHFKFNEAAAQWKFYHYLYIFIIYDSTHSRKCCAKTVFHNLWGFCIGDFLP